MEVIEGSNEYRCIGRAFVRTSLESEKKIVYFRSGIKKNGGGIIGIEIMGRIGKLR
jgi:hypothetical protein